MSSVYKDIKNQKRSHYSSQLTKATAMISSFRGRNYFLSNCFPSKIVYNGEIYATAEHAIQAAMCAQESDKEIIRSLKCPKTAKKVGRKAEIRADWVSERDVVMEAIIRAKFQSPKLKYFLLKTKPQHIVVKNYWHDLHWGVCSCSKHKF